MTLPRRLPDAVLGGVVTLFALGLRAVGIGWGLPNDLRVFSLHPDEQIVASAAQAVNPLAGDLTPGFYNYGTFYLFLLRLFGGLLGAETLGGWHMAGRIISLFAGALTAAFVFGAARAVGGRLMGVVAGFLIAVAPALVMHSRFQTVDSVSTMLIAATVWAAFRLRDAGEKSLGKWVILVGVLAGLAAGTKYLGVLAVIVPLMMIPAGPRRAGYAVGMLLATAIAFVLATPGVILDTEAFVRDFKYEMTHTATGHGLLFIETAPGFLYQISNLFAGYGLLLTLLGGAGVLLAVKHRLKWGWALIIAFGLLYVVIGRSEVKFLRYAFPLMIPLAIGGGYLVARAHRRKDAWGKVAVAFGLIGAIGLEGGGLRGSLENTLWMSGEDPRDRAARTLKAMDRSGAVGLPSDPWFYTIPLWPEVGVTRGVSREKRLAQMDETARPTAVVHRPADRDYYDWDVRLLTEDRPERVAFSTLEAYDPARLADHLNRLDGVPKIVTQRYVAFKKVLERDYQIESVYGADGEKVAGTHDLAYVRPVVMIWKRKSNGF